MSGALSVNPCYMPQPANQSSDTMITPEAMAGLPTKDRILAAAAQVFTEKGFAATTTREIAELAGVNIATLHYHHRSKEVLFEQVAHGAMDRFREIHDEVFDIELPLRDIIHAFVDKYTDLLLARPYLVMFVMSESEKDPAQFSEVVNFREWAGTITACLGKAVAEGTIRPVEPFDFISNLVGMTVYPFLTRAMTMHEFEMTAEEFRERVEARKASVPAMLWGWLKL